MLNSVKLHTEQDFAAMRRAGRLAAEVLDYITPYIKPDVSTGELDQLCHNFILDHGATPAPLNYRGFPKSTCTSINEVVCHGIPDNARKLKEGDILNLDITVILDGWHGDTSRMFTVGDSIRSEASRLIEVTYQAMMRGIEQVRPGQTLGDLGFTIQTVAEQAGFSVVRDFCGHGIGRLFHDQPNVMHFGSPNQGLTLEAGMFFTIEPMVNEGKPDVKILKDGWTAVTRDRKLSAQFEHTIGVTETGVEIFTNSPKGWDKPPYVS